MSISLPECEDNLYLPSFDAKKMKELLEREYYNPNLLDQMTCVLKNITTPGENGNNIRLLRYLKFERIDPIKTGRGKINDVELFSISRVNHSRRMTPLEALQLPIFNELQNHVKQSRNFLYPYFLFLSSGYINSKKFNSAKIGFENGDNSSNNLYVLNQLLPKNSTLVKDFIQNGSLTSEILAELVFQYLFSYVGILQGEEIKTVEFVVFLSCYILFFPQAITIKYLGANKKITTNYLLIIPFNLDYQHANLSFSEMLALRILSISWNLGDISEWKEAGNAKSFIQHFKSYFPIHQRPFKFSFDNMIKVSEYSSNITNLESRSDHKWVTCDNLPCIRKEDLIFPLTTLEISDYLDLYEYLRSGGELKNVKFNHREALNKLQRDIDAVYKNMETSLLNLFIPDIQIVSGFPANPDNPNYEIDDHRKAVFRQVREGLYSIKSVDLELIYLRRVLQCLEFIWKRNPDLKSPDSEEKIKKIILAVRSEVKRRKDQFIPITENILTWIGTTNAPEYKNQVEKYLNLENILY